MKRKYVIGLLLVLVLLTMTVLVGCDNESTNNGEMKNEINDMMDNDNKMKNDNDNMMDDKMNNEGMNSNEMDESEDHMKDNDMSEDEMMDDVPMMDEPMNDGPMAPEFSLMSLNNEKVSLSNLKGQKVYVKFWASWCSICLAGLDELDELSTREDFQVYTIVAPGERGEKDKADFVEWFNGLGYEHIEVLFDEDGEIQKEFGIRGFPTSSYIGSDGVLVKTIPGHVNNEQIIETFEMIK